MTVTVPVLIKADFFSLQHMCPARFIMKLVRDGILRARDIMGNVVALCFTMTCTKISSRMVPAVAHLWQCQL